MNDLAHRIAAFNRFPIRYVNADWVPDGWKAIWVRALLDGGRAEVRLGEELLRHWSLDPGPCFDFGSFGHKLALVDAAPLRRTVFLAGLARHGERISRLLERSRVMDFRKQVGEDAYRFAMFRAPLIAGSLGTMGVTEPEAGKAQEGDASACPDFDWKALAMRAGLRMLGACLAAGPSGLAGRAALKFPRESAAVLLRERESGSQGSGPETRAPETSGPAASRPDAEAFARMFRKILAQEVDPAWDALLS